MPLKSFDKYNWKTLKQNDTLIGSYTGANYHYVLLCIMIAGLSLNILFCFKTKRDTRASNFGPKPYILFGHKGFCPGNSALWGTP
jgi:hypothetical protein